MVTPQDRARRFALALLSLLLSSAPLLVRTAAARPACAASPQYPEAVLQLTGNREPFTPARPDAPYEFSLKKLLTARRGIHYGSALKLSVEPLGERLLLIDTAARGLLLKSAGLSGKDVVSAPDWVLPGPGLQTGLFRVLGRISARGFSMEPAVAELFQERGFAWVDGVISTGLFRHWRVRLDLRRSRLSLLPYQTSLPATSPEWEARLDRNWWIVKADVRGKPANLLLDTGTPQTWLSDEWISRNIGHISRREPREGPGGGRFYEAGLWEIAIPGVAPLTVSCLSGEAGQLPVPSGAALDGVLGFDALRGLVLEFDYRGAKLHVRR